MIRKALFCLIGLLLGLPPAFAAFDVGFDFRRTPGFVIDPVYATFASLGATPYPTTVSVNGQTVTFGWETTGVNAGSSDRTTAGDPRLAGASCQQNDGNISVFRVDLPGTGVYTIGLAAGDPAGFTQVNYVGLFDNYGLLSSFRVRTGYNAIDMADATGAAVLLTSWPGASTSIQESFGTTILRLQLGGTADFDYSCVSHLRVTFSRNPLPPSGAWSFLLQ